MLEITRVLWLIAGLRFGAGEEGLLLRCVALSKGLQDYQRGNSLLYSFKLFQANMNMLMPSLW